MADAQKPRFSKIVPKGTVLLEQNWKKTGKRLMTVLIYAERGGGSGGQVLLRQKFVV